MAIFNKGPKLNSPKFIIPGSIILLMLIAISAISSRSETKIVLLPEDFDRPISPEEIKADLEYLVQTIENVHINPYEHFPETKFKQEMAQLGARIRKPMTRKELYRELAPLVALLNDGHTNVKLLIDEINHRVMQNGKWFPLDVRLAGSGVIVTGNYSANPEISNGSRLVAINGISATELASNLPRYVSSQRTAHRRQTVEEFFIFYLWLIYGWDDQFEVTFVPEGKSEPQVCQIDGITYGSFLKKKGSLREGASDHPYYFTQLEGLKAGLLTVDQFIYPNEFETFINETMKTIDQEGIENLIIDIRRNGGGTTDASNILLRRIASEPVRNFSSYDLKVSSQIKTHFKNQIPGLIRWLPLQYFFSLGRQVWGGPEGKTITVEGKYLEPAKAQDRFTGDIFVLVGPGTFSTASDFAAVVQDFKLGTLIGEETGGLACSYGDTYSCWLPGSKLEVGISFKYFVRPSGLKSAISIEPHYQVGGTAAEEAAGVDLVMEFTKELVTVE